MNNAVLGLAVNRYLPAKVGSRRVTVTCRELFKSLIRHTRHNEHCWPSLAYLAECIGVTPRTLQNQLGLLGQLGLVRVQYRPGRSSLYAVSPEVMAFVHGNPVASPPYPRKVFRGQIPAAHEKFSGTHEKFSPGTLKKQESKNPPLPPAVAEAVAPPSTVAPAGGRGLTSSLPSQRAPRHAATPLVHSDFERLWQAWPVKQARDAAHSTFLFLARSRRLPALDALLSSVATMVAHDSRWRRGKVPMLSRWLREGRWMDQPFVESPASALFSAPATSHDQSISQAVAATATAARCSAQAAASESLFQKLWTVWGNPAELPKAIGFWISLDSGQRSVAFEKTIEYVSNANCNARETLVSWLRKTIEGGICEYAES